jgi:hypothetical protein
MDNSANGYRCCRTNQSDKKCLDEHDNMVGLLKSKSPSMRGLHLSKKYRPLNRHIQTVSFRATSPAHVRTRRNEGEKGVKGA